MKGIRSILLLLPILYYSTETGLSPISIPTVASAEIATVKDYNIVSSGSPPSDNPVPLLLPVTSSEAPGEEEVLAEEERLQARKAEALLHEEFRHEVSTRGGPFIGEALRDDSVDISTYLRRDNERGPLRGFAVTGTTRKMHQMLPESTQDQFLDILSGEGSDPAVALEKEGVEPKPRFKELVNADRDHISLFEGGTNPETASHEYSHLVIDIFRRMPYSKVEGDPEKERALRTIKDRLPAHGDEEELFNRRFDAYRSSSPQDFASYSDAVVDKVARMAAEDPSAKKAELVKKARRLVEQEARNSEEVFSKLEAAAETLRGVPAPKGTTWQNFYKKRAEQRRFQVFNSKEYRHLLEQSEVLDRLAAKKK